LAALALLSFGNASGPGALLREVREHLELAKRYATQGRADGALAHASVVIPDRQLRVRVDVSNVARSEQGLYRNALSSAFAMWETALGQRLFVVSEMGDPDVTIEFKSDVSHNGVEVCGHSEWKRGVLNPDTNPTVVFTALVQVRMLKPNGRPLSFEQLRACAAHELGHVLGLDDSRHSGDLMGPMDFNRPAVYIRPEEVAGLLTARQEASAIRRSFFKAPQRLKD
jgi:predicted Zn-dependent protease